MAMMMIPPTSVAAPQVSGRQATMSPKSVSFSKFPPALIFWASTYTQATLRTMMIGRNSRWYTTGNSHARAMRISRRFSRYPGLSPRAVCAFVQNDGYGMAGVTGLRRVLERQSGADDMVKALDAILAQPGQDPPRNGIGPVGVYQRNTFASRDAYVSLKDWERRNGTPCRLVVTVGTYNAVAKFAAYARYKGEKWLLSAVSFTGADALRRELAASRIEDGVVVSQVVPPLDAALPIVVAARSALGSDFGYVSLEGYIVGRLFLAVAREVEGELTRDAFMRAALGRRFNIGGLALDFTDDNQGSDLVVVDLLEDGRYRTLDAGDWRRLLN